MGKMNSADNIMPAAAHRSGLKLLRIAAGFVPDCLALALNGCLTLEPAFTVHLGKITLKPLGIED
jgi:hypothetical protein